MEGFWTAIILLTVLQWTGAQAALGYEGCYADQEVRNFPHAEKWDGAQTNDRCISHCRSNGYAYAATEFTWQCFCGTEDQFNNLPSQSADWECLSNCAGNSAEKCGGVWRMSVYAVLALENEIRLIGDVGEEGRVEVRAVDTKDWGTVCSQGFDMDDATVACKMLGLGDPKHIRDSSYFGQGSGEIKMANLGCGGHESSLFSCSYDGPGSHSCSHGDDVGLVCEGVISVGAIIGIVIGVLIAISIIITIVCLACQKNKKPGRVLNASAPVGGPTVVQTSNMMQMQPVAGYAMPPPQAPPYQQHYPPPPSQPNAPPPPPSYDPPAKPSGDQLYAQ